MNENANNDLANLELSATEMQAMGELVVTRAVAHLGALHQAPSCGDFSEIESLCRSMQESAPEQGSSLEALLDPLFDEWIPRSFNAPGPGYMAYIPGGGVYPAALADFIADTTNRYTGVWQAAPALVQLEANVLDWLREWMQFPASARGLFTTGGSMAMFNAIACAREKLLGNDIRAGVLYVSSQSHHCIVKAAKLAGIAHDRVRIIDVDDDFRLRVDLLERAIADDRALGLEPFMVFSTAGTTNTGAVDPINAVADLAVREHLWHHVDGAYGGFFHMVPALRPLLDGLSRADSLTLDPHKGLFMPYGTGALLVRDGEALRALHSSTAGYLPENQNAFYDPAQYGPDLSRGFPGLRIWLSLKLFGTARFRAALAEKRELAVWAAAQVAQIPGIVMDAMPQLSLFAFHIESDELDSLHAQNAATRALMDRVTDRGRVMLSGAMVGERFLGRVCVLSFRTRRAEMETCVQHLAETTAQLIAEAPDRTADKGSIKQAQTKAI
ncbi:MAG TPA: aminotransferase class V-fold PLP-dependent enzyme [Dokdonella sp.]|uniref:pyridoxal phosphate-dependent decarboxylase family protein n=1 Tax=Dokdonella sp. TaxID=2291710 RepID=UPI002D7EE833|nr:aminotransferase class V-fold PLP-dependent enzyme [Dokdonella sp.]HET9031489.1 aminotransferase class V-fold PLP-dependent enzyme [Dokdonella sp.]